jgi:UDP-N-acetylmuramate--alanine ligase
MTRFTKRIHLVGIGGAGMSPLAEVLLSRGHTVTGSDRAVSDASRRLETLGIKVQYNHEPNFVKNAELLVYSSAVREDNAERRYAADNGIPEIRRAEVLGDIMRSNFTVCVSGTHGKTTTTSLVGTVLTDAKMSPTVLVGGMLRSVGSHAIVGNGGIVVAEADEYDRSFLAMCPTMAVLTNIEADHLDCYADLDEIKDAFVEFTDRVPFDGAVIACIDDEGVRSILPRIRRSLFTYGTDSKADFRAVDITFEGGRTKFGVVHKGGRAMGRVSIGIPGTHNVMNTLAALAVAVEMGMEFSVAADSVSKFLGVKRRFEIVGVVNGVTVVDDYAHHPGEITATLDAARSRGYKRVAAVFQPHLYTRTRDFMEQFAGALSAADVVIVTDIYKAREEPIPGVSAENIVKIMNGIDKKRVDNNVDNMAYYVNDKNDVLGVLRGKVSEGDIVIFMGAGDIWEIAENVVDGGTI